MSLLNTRATLSHRTALPSSATYEGAIALLRDHEALFRLDPEFRSCTVDPPPASPSPNTKYYTVTDHMEALPKGLWDTTVKFTAAITDIPSGIEWRIRAPLGIEQTTFWTIEPNNPAIGEDSKCFYLVEEVEIYCSRFLVGIMRNKIEAGYKSIHIRFGEKLAGSSSM